MTPLSMLCATLAVGLANSAVAAQGGVDELRIGLIPEMNVFEQVERYQGLADHLSEELERPVRLSMVSGYGNIVDRLRNQDLDAAFLGSFTGALASAQLGMEPIARPVNADGTSTYYGQIFVRRDSRIQNLEDLKGKRLALVEYATTAGYVFPLAYFSQHGVENLEDYFSEVRLWGSHDASLLAVLDGRADVGSAKNTIFPWLARSDPRVESELRVLASSQRVPSNALFVVKSTDPSLRVQLRSMLLSLEEHEQGQKVLERLGVLGFRATTLEDYDVVFSMAAAAGIDLERYTYVNE